MRARELGSGLHSLVTHRHGLEPGAYARGVQLRTAGVVVVCVLFGHAEPGPSHAPKVTSVNMPLQLASAQVNSRNADWYEPRMKSGLTDIISPSVGYEEESTGMLAYAAALV